MGLDKQPEHEANKIKELHHNVRHITQLAMSWFAFFVTVNYVTMGWLAKPSSGTNAPIDHRIVEKLAYVFIWQNLLGLVGLFWVLVAAAQMKSEVGSLEWATPDTKLEATAPDVTPPDEHSEAVKPEGTVPADKKETRKDRIKVTSIPTGLYNAIGIFLMSVLVSLVWAWLSIL